VCDWKSSTTGIGHVTALELARKGAHVILTARNRTKGMEALDAILVEVPDAKLELLEVPVIHHIATPKPVISFRWTFQV